MSSRHLRIALGVLLVAAGLVLVFSPLAVASALSRPAETKPQLINLRASWGGAVLGIGAFVAWLDAARPWKRALVGAVMWLMIGIGAARAIGFVLDGGPDTLQWVWLTAEVAIAAACALGLRKMRAAPG